SRMETGCMAVIAPLCHARRRGRSRYCGGQLLLSGEGDVVAGAGRAIARVRVVRTVFCLVRRARLTAGLVVPAFSTFGGGPRSIGSVRLALGSGGSGVATGSADGAGSGAA